MRWQNWTKVASHIQQRRIDTGAMEIVDDARVRDTVSALTFDITHWKEDYKEKIKDIIPKIDNLKNPLSDEKNNKFIKLIMQDPELWKQIVSENPSDFEEHPKKEKQFKAVVPATQEEVLEAHQNWRYWPWLPAAELPKGKTLVKFRDLMWNFLKKIEKIPPPNRD